MIRSKIAGIKTFGTNVVVKIKNGQKTKKCYIVVYGKDRKSVINLLLENFEFLEYETTKRTNQI